MAADTYRTKVAADDAEAEKDLDTAVEATYRIRSQYGVAGGLAGSVSGKLTVSGCVASVYVDGYDFAGGLVGKVVDNKGDQPARIENSYVGGHTSAGKFLVHPTPAEENFDTTQGRYNVISRDTIADVFFLTPEYLAKVYKRQTGHNLKDYIIGYRIEMAKQLLADDIKSISDISAEVGFDNFSYFSTVFKKYTGITPGEYRRSKKS